MTVQFVVTWQAAVTAREWWDPAATWTTSSPDNVLIHRGWSLTHTFQTHYVRDFHYCIHFWLGERIKLFVSFCSPTWRADLRGRAAPQSRVPSSRLLCLGMAARHPPPPPLALPPGSDHQKIFCTRLRAVAVETLKEKNTLVKNTLVTMWFHQKIQDLVDTFESPNDSNATCLL